MKLLHEHKYSEHKEILNTSKVSVIHARTYTKKILFFSRTFLLFYGVVSYRTRFCRRCPLEHLLEDLPRFCDGCTSKTSKLRALGFPTRVIEK